MTSEIRKAALESVAVGVLLGLALVLPAGTLAWPMASAILGSYALFSVVGLLILPQDLIAERSRFRRARRRRIS